MILVSNLENGIHFYQKFGLKMIVHAPPEYARFECTPAGTTLPLPYVEHLPSPFNILTEPTVNGWEKTIRNSINWFKKK